jgi:hypothetical protein
VKSKRVSLSAVDEAPALLLAQRLLDESFFHLGIR